MDTKRFIQGPSIHPPDPNAFLFMDASQYGWIAHLNLMGLPFYGCWTEDQSKLHINFLKIMAIHFAVKKAKQYIHPSCVMISTDNTTVVSYINKHGGTHSPDLCVEVWEILHWCLEHRIRHLAGKLSISADHISRLDSHRMVFGSIGDIFHFSNAQFSQCGFVCDSIQSQTPIVCISSSGKSSLSDRCIINEMELST